MSHGTHAYMFSTVKFFTVASATVALLLYLRWRHRWQCICNAPLQKSMGRPHGSLCESRRMAWMFATVKFCTVASATVPFSLRKEHRCICNGPLQTSMSRLRRNPCRPTIIGRCPALPRVKQVPKASAKRRHAAACGIACDFGAVQTETFRKKFGGRNCFWTIFGPNRAEIACNSTRRCTADAWQSLWGPV